MGYFKTISLEVDGKIAMMLPLFLDKLTVYSEKEDRYQVGKHLINSCYKLRNAKPKFERNETNYISSSQIINPRNRERVQMVQETIY